MTAAALRLPNPASARERIGHIALAAPVSHIWYFKGIPSRMGLILDISPRVLEKVLYFASYIVLDPGTTGLQLKQVLSEKEYRDAVEKYGYGTFRVGMGAEAIQELLKNIDLEKDSAELRKALQESTGQKRARIIKRLEVVDALPQFRKQAGMDDHERNSGDPAGYSSPWYSWTAAGSHLRLKRPVSPDHQPEQPSRQTP